MPDTSNVHPLRRSVEAVPLRLDLSGFWDVRDQIPAGDAITAPVLFNDMVWDLGGHPDWKDKAGGQTRIDFEAIAPRWRVLAKLWVLASLDPSCVHSWLGEDDADAEVWSSYKESIKTVTAQANVKALALGLRRLQAAGVEQVDVDGWDHITSLFTQPLNRTEARTNKRVSPKSSKLWADQLRSLHTFGGVLGWDNPFGSEPWGERDLSGVFKVSQAGRKIELNSVRPTDLVGQTLGIAAFTIDVLADDILAHTRWWVAAHQAAEVPDSDGDGKEVMTGLLRELADENEGKIPGAYDNKGRMKPVYQPLGYLVGIDESQRAFQWVRQGLRNAQRLDGLTYELDLTVSPCPLPITKLPHRDTGELVPWTGRLLWRQEELHWWWSALLYSCAFYLNATLGLRDGDRDLLAPGCVKPRTVRNNAGVDVIVNELHAYKQKQHMVPKPTSFMVGSRVKRAVEVVEQMHSILGIEPTPQKQVPGSMLFDFQLNLASHRGGRDAVHLDQGYMRWFRGAAERLYAAGIAHSDGSELPTTLGEKVVRITTLQAYASRPLGQALAAAYGQWDGGTRVMGGYVGDVMTEIVLPDVDEAAEYARLGIGVTLRRAAERIDVEGELTGAGLPRLQQALERHPDLGNAEPLTRKRAERIGGRQQNLETGPYTLCVYEPDGALCGGKGSADFRLCRPGECRNSVMTRSDRARLELRRRKDTERMPVHQRNADKIAQGVPEIIAEFDGVDDSELVQIILDDTDDFIREYLELS